MSEEKCKAKSFLTTKSYFEEYIPHMVDTSAYINVNGGFFQFFCELKFIFFFLHGVKLPV